MNDYGAGEKRRKKWRRRKRRRKLKQQFFAKCRENIDTFFNLMYSRCPLSLSLWMKTFRKFPAAEEGGGGREVEIRPRKRRKGGRGGGRGIEQEVQRGGEKTEREEEGGDFKDK